MTSTLKLAFLRLYDSKNNLSAHITVYHLKFRIREWTHAPSTFQMDDYLEWEFQVGR